MSKKEKKDCTQEMQLRSSRLARVVFFLSGTFFVVLGAIGIVLPVLPTTPFMLLAAACYARSSLCFYNWLLNNKIFGPTIRQWREDGSVALKTKVLAIALLVLTLGTSVTFFVPKVYVRLVLVLVGVWVIWFILRLPTRAKKRDPER